MKTFIWIVGKFRFELFAHHSILRVPSYAVLPMAFVKTIKDYRRFGWKVVAGHTDWDDSMRHESRS